MHPPTFAAVLFDPSHSCIYKEMDFIYRLILMLISQNDDLLLKLIF